MTLVSCRGLHIDWAVADLWQGITVGTILILGPAALILGFVTSFMSERRWASALPWMLIGAGLLAIAMGLIGCFRPGP